MQDGVFSIPLSVELPAGDFEIEYAAHSAVNTSKSPADTTTAKSIAGRSQPVKLSAARSNGSPPKQLAPSTRSVSIRPANDFLAGSENRLLAEAVQSILGRQVSPYNPLLLCGPPGSGKTHIARGLVGAWAEREAKVNAKANAQTNAIAKTNDGTGAGREIETRHASAILTNGTDFARQFAAALDQDSPAQDSIARWRDRMRGAALFVLDDFNQLAAKRAAQTELLHTIDAVQASDGQVVLTSRLPIDKINGLPPALLSRLSAGLVVQLAMPNSAVRLALIERYAALRDIALNGNAARLLADGLSVTVPELYGTLHELHVASSVENRAIDNELVKRHLIDRRAQIQPTVRSITSVSAKYFGLKVTELTGPTRRRAVVQARNVAIFLSRQLAGKSLEQLGTFFGGRDHTTVLHSYRTIEARYRTDPTIRRAVSDLRKMLAHA